MVNAFTSLEIDFQFEIIASKKDIRNVLPLQTNQ